MFQRCFIALIPLIVFTVSSGFGQDFILPRDPDKLMSRVQQYWDAVKTDKRNTALQLVLSEDRDRFLEGSLSVIIKDVHIAGLDSTGDRNKALIHGTVKQIPLGGDLLIMPFSELWVWRDNNWYRHIESKEEKASAFARAEEPEVKNYKKAFEDSLALEADVFDAGTLVRNSIRTLRIPLNYTGKWDLSVETLPPVTFIHTRQDNLVAPIRDFALYIDTDKAGEEFSVPLRLRFWSGIAAVEKTLTVKGKIFSPVTFRGSPEPIVPGKPYSVFVKNNTDETAQVQYFTTNDDFNIVSSPLEIPPHKEAEIVVESVPERQPRQLGLLLRNTVGGLNQFVYKFSAAP